MEKKEFSKFLSDVYSHGTLMSAIGLGHDLGLFRVFYDTDQPLSLQEIATKTDLKERYTKEWLSCMVVSGILLQDRTSSLYTMPQSHKEELKVHALFAPILTVMGKRTDLVKNCFRKEGPYGFGYGEDQHFFNWHVDYKGHVTDVTLDETIIPILKQQGIVSELESGINALDIGCGEASLTIGLAKRFPNTRFTGLECDDYAIELASKNAQNLSNLTIMKGDAENLQVSCDKQFDWVFMHDVLHDLPRPHKVIEEIYKVLKDDGSYTLIDGSFQSNPLDHVGNKFATMCYSISMFICLPASMQSEPHIGYGACWGMDNIEKALKEAKFNVSSVVKGSYAYFYCTKQDGTCLE